jgi:glutathione S-transferase
MLREVGLPATSPTFPKYTLPGMSRILLHQKLTKPCCLVIADPSSDPNEKPTYVAESFDIAVYLDEKYPAPKYPAVFAPGTRALQKITSEFFTNEVGYALMPFILPLIAKPGFLDDRGHEYFVRTRQARLKKNEDPAETGSKKWGEIHDKWDDFGKKLDYNTGPGEEGPFVMGNQISFTDFAVGGMFHWLRRGEGGDMPRWKIMTEWQGGRWARLWAEIEKLEKASNEVV